MDGWANAVVERTAQRMRADQMKRRVEAPEIGLGCRESEMLHTIIKDTGEIAARRTAWWRFYDFMWGLHIMDLQTREDAHNPWLIGFGIVLQQTR